MRRAHPDVIFLAEAFTRPPMMQALAKIGFHQSYTYFTWRNTAAEVTEYVTELAGEMHEYFRPNFFANTPDILTEYLQHGGPDAFRARLVLAATLSPSYGIYSGFEYFEREPREPGSEEYLDSEKYEVKARDLDGPLLPLVGRLNAIRRRHRAFHHLENVMFLESANESLVVYAKRALDDLVVCCVNVNPHAYAEGLVTIPAELGVADTFTVHDLLTGERYSWHTGGNYVLLSPGCAHLMSVEL
jgi:starch synthase (maltosyl-transferring)